MTSISYLPLQGWFTGSSRFTPSNVSSVQLISDELCAIIVHCYILPLDVEVAALSHEEVVLTEVHYLHLGQVIRDDGHVFQGIAPDSPLDGRFGVARTFKGQLGAPKIQYELSHHLG